MIKKEVLRKIEEKYKKEKKVYTVGTLNENAWEFALPIIIEETKKATLQKFDLMLLETAQNNFKKGQESIKQEFLEKIEKLKRKLKYNVVEKESFISFTEEAFERDIGKGFEELLEDLK